LEHHLGRENHIAKALEKCISASQFWADWGTMQKNVLTTLRAQKEGENPREIS